jgi:hypothetical protein
LVPAEPPLEPATGVPPLPFFSVHVP